MSLCKGDMDTTSTHLARDRSGGPVEDFGVSSKEGAITQSRGNNMEPDRLTGILHMCKPFYKLFYAVFKRGGIYASISFSP